MSALYMKHIYRYVYIDGLVKVWLMGSCLPQGRIAVASLCWEIIDKVNYVFSSNKFRTKLSNMFTAVKSLVPVRSGFEFKNATFNLVLLIGNSRSFHDNALGRRGILLTIRQHCFRWWLGAVSHQAITWANVAPHKCCLLRHSWTPIS